MITIKYKGVEANCTTVDEAVELIKKLDLENITTQPNVPNQPWPHPVRDHTTIYKYPIGINECKSNLPNDYDDTISKINSIDNYKLPDDYCEDYKTDLFKR